MTQRLILFNGPPRSGKDTAALSFWNSHSRGFTVFDRMSMPIKRAFASLMSLNINKHGDVEYWEERKEEIIPLLGVSYRQWQIDFSEKFMKPLYGEDVFVKLFISRQKRQHRMATILVPDIGFPIEPTTLSDHFRPENILLFKIYREGCTFANDSRGYLTPTGPNIPHTINITNDRSIEEFRAEIDEVITRWLHQRDAQKDPRYDY